MSGNFASVAAVAIFTEVCFGFGVVAVAGVRKFVVSYVAFALAVSAAVRLKLGVLVIAVGGLFSRKFFALRRNFALHCIFGRANTVFGGFARAAARGFFAIFRHWLRFGEGGVLGGKLRLF